MSINLAILIRLWIWNILEPTQVNNSAWFGLRFIFSPADDHPPDRTKLNLSRASFTSLDSYSTSSKDFPKHIFKLLASFKINKTNVGLTSQFPPTHQRSISLLGSPWTGHVTWGGASNLGASITDMWGNSNCRSWLASTNSHSENWFSFSTNFNWLRKNITQSSWTKTDYTRDASYPNLIWPLLPLSFSRTRRLPRAWTAGKGWRLTPLKAIPRNTNTLLSHGLYQWPKQARLGRSS